MREGEAHFYLIKIMFVITGMSDPSAEHPYMVALSTLATYVSHVIL